MAGQSGNFFFPSDLPIGVVGYHERLTAVAATGPGIGTTETPIFRLNVPCRAGFSYLVICPRVNITVSAAGVIGRARIRASTTGNATITYLDIGTKRTRQDETSNTDIDMMIGYFQASSDGTLSLIQTVHRVGASGTVGMFGSSVEVNSMIVIELDGAPASSGTDL
jgi:hypothetical protein